jgi:RNA polymerase sigma factor (sigma-70 family)
MNRDLSSGLTLLSARDLRRLVLSRCAAAGFRPPHPSIEDCIVEGELALWRGRAAAALLPISASQRAYLLVCAIHAIDGHLGRERSWYIHTTNLLALEETRPNCRANFVPLPVPGARTSPASLADLVLDELILTAFTRLNHRARRILDLAILDELTDREIGEVLGIAGKAVEKARNRALAQMRKAIFTPALGSGPDDAAHG